MKKEKKSSTTKGPGEKRAGEEPKKADATPVEPEQTPAPEEVEQVCKDRLIRLQADFDNFRKRTLREREDIYRRANADLLQELLPVLDHYEMGIQTAREQEVDNSVVSGLELVYGQFCSALKKFGLQAFVSEGGDFDPHRHECISHLPSQEHPKDRVIAEVRKGYMLGDQLLRAAQVVVSSGAPGEEVAPSQEEEVSHGEQ